MKKTLIISLLVLGMAACQKENNLTKTGTVQDLSEQAKKFIGLQSSFTSSNSAQLSSSLSQSSKSMNNFLNATGVGTGEVVTNGQDSLARCGQYTESVDPDGTINYSVDYGTGCEQNYGDYVFTQWGKYTSSYRYTNKQDGSIFYNDYFSKSKSVNFGGKYTGKDYVSQWLSNGSSSYEGASTYDTLKHSYQGWSTSTDSSTYQYDSTSYTYTSYSKFNYENNKSVVQVRNYKYANGDNFYNSIVTVPIVTLYGCSANQRSDSPVRFCGVMALPVSGLEVVHYRQDGKEGSFEVDYGNGTCDSIFTITENGVVIIINQNDIPTIMESAKKG